MNEMLSQGSPHLGVVGNPGIVGALFFSHKKTSPLEGRYGENPKKKKEAELVWCS